MAVLPNRRLNQRLRVRAIETNIERRVQHLTVVAIACSGLLLALLS